MEVDTAKKFMMRVKYFNTINPYNVALNMLVQSNPLRQMLDEVFYQVPKHLTH